MTITFLNPIALALLIPLPLLLGLLIWRVRSRRSRLYSLGDAGLIDRLITGPRAASGWWRLVLWSGATISLIVALARPAWGVNMDVIELQGVSVVAVLDVSNSMNAQDVLPSRLERAKLALHDLFDGLGGNEVGLVLFAGSAIVQFPLTTDAESAQAFLSAASSESITQQGTAIANALHTALNLFDAQSPSARIIVLVTDGEDQEGDIEAAAAEAAAAGVTIYTIGYGGPTGVPIPILGADGQVVTYKADTSGNLVLSNRDEPTLQTLAEQTGGIYQRASASGSEITHLAQLINEAQRGLLDSRTESRSIERFGIFTLIAILLLSVEILTPGLRGASA